MGRVCRTVWKRNACNVLVGKPGGKKILRRHRRKLENIMIDFTEMGCLTLKSNIFIPNDQN
jgi:hypothetical protein